MIVLLSAILVVVIGVLSLWPFRAALSSPEVRFERFPLLLFCAAFFIYWGVGTLLSMTRPDLLVVPEAIEYFPTGLLLAGAGIVAFQAGFFRVGLRPPVERPARGTFAGPSSDLMTVFAVFFVAFAVLRVYLIFGGYYFFGSVVESWEQLSSYLTSAVLLGKFGGLIVSTGIVVGARRTAVAVSVAAFEMTLLFLSTIKGDFILWLGYFVLLFIVIRGARVRRLTLAAVAVAAVLAFPAMQLMRTAFDINQSDRNYIRFANEAVASWLGDPGYVVDAPQAGELFREEYPYKRIAAIELLATTQYMIHQRGRPYLYGLTIFDGMQMLLPRVLWPNKPPVPKSEEAMLVDEYGLPDNDRLGTVLSSAYSNFGSVGVVVISWLYGLTVGLLWRWSRGRRVVFVVLLGALPDILKPEQMVVGVLSGLRSFAVMLVVVGAVEFVLRGRRRNLQATDSDLAARAVRET